MYNKKFRLCVMYSGVGRGVGLYNRFRPVKLEGWVRDTAFKVDIGFGKTSATAKPAIGEKNKQYHCVGGSFLVQKTC